MIERRKCLTLLPSGRGKCLTLLPSGRGKCLALQESGRGKCLAFLTSGRGKCLALQTSGRGKCLALQSGRGKCLTLPARGRGKWMEADPHLPTRPIHTLDYMLQGSPRFPVTETGTLIITTIDNFRIALFSGVPKLTALYNILQHFLSFTNIIHIIMTIMYNIQVHICYMRSSKI